MQARAVRAISYFPASAAANRCRTRRWAWLHRDALIAALDREIATEADDAASLAHEDRQKREAEVMGDLLDIERQEAAFVWKAMAHGLPVFHRNDTARYPAMRARHRTACNRCAPVVAGNVVAAGINSDPLHSRVLVSCLTPVCNGRGARSVKQSPCAISTRSAGSLSCSPGARTVSSASVGRKRADRTPLPICSSATTLA